MLTGCALTRRRGHVGRRGAEEQDEGEQQRGRNENTGRPMTSAAAMTVAPRGLNDARATRTRRIREISGMNTMTSGHDGVVKT
jgi:hypothetical protein